MSYGLWRALAVMVSLSACHGNGAGAIAEMPAAEAFLRNYADIAFAGYSDAATGARTLLRAVDGLTAAPSQARLELARKAWIEARVPYLQTEGFRFYDGPIDEVEMLVNTWPIDESYIESTGGAGGGIVDDAKTYPELTIDLLKSLNAKDGETSISTGYHAVEFLLWGRDTSETGPGDRSPHDYEQGTSDDPAPRRRGAYLHFATELLVQQMDQLARAWAPSLPNNYRAAFLSTPPREALARVIRGMGALSGPELGGERLTVAYETKDQENEHSCFSDNTHNDVILDAQGIANIGAGHYERTDGTAVAGLGLCDVVQSRDPHLAEQLRHDLEASVAAARSIPAPFDRAIIGSDDAPGRVAVHRTIQSLEAQAATLTKVASTLGLSAARAARR